jgi:glycosyltransferase involved in cell wall biosynthesis
VNISGVTSSLSGAMTISADQVSVVVPTYNDLGRIGDALTSIVEQTLPPAEIVVSDDASPEDVEGFVRQFAERYSGSVQIRYVRRPSNGGDAAARNAGIAAATGEWIAICDSDDIWLPTKLERQIGFIRDWSADTRISLLGTHGYNVNDAKKVVSPAIMGPSSVEDYNAVRARGGLFFLIHSSILFSRADYDEVGGYTTAEYGAANEFDMFCRMAELGVVMNLPDQLVYYRKRAGSMQLDLFWERHRNVTRLWANQRRRAQGQAPLSKEQFAAQEASASARIRLIRRKRVWGMYYYRAGATDMVNGHRLRGSLELALASVLDGTRFRGGLRNLRQRGLSRAARARRAHVADAAPDPGPGA